jgi:hypothetical protein
LGAGAHKLE